MPAYAAATSLNWWTRSPKVDPLAMCASWSATGSRGLKGVPEAITAVWDRAIVQTCVIHLVRNIFRYASRKYWDQIAKEIRPVYTAPTDAAANERFVEFTAHWGQQYPAIIRLWENASSEFVPFLDYEVEIRRSVLVSQGVSQRI
jgi:putative transposase